MTETLHIILARRFNSGSRTTRKRGNSVIYKNKFRKLPLIFTIVKNFHMHDLRPGGGGTLPPSCPTGELQRGRGGDDGEQRQKWESAKTLPRP